MKLSQRMIVTSIKHPKMIVWLMVLMTVVLGALMIGASAIIRLRHAQPDVIN